jgi:hypothetical protein
MMKWTRYWLLMPVLMVQAFSSCSFIDEPEYDGNGSVKASLAFSVSQANVSQTRMADPVVQMQGNGRSYRGLGDVYMIPFAISGTQITSTDHPLRLLQDASLLESHDPQTGNYGGFYLYNAYTLIRGINAFLVYGRASTNSPTLPSGVPDKVYFGSLKVPGLVNPDLNTLRFRPDPIYPSTEAPAEAQLLADYLTFIAQTPGWSSTTDETLKLLYKVFTGQENNGTMVMAGASVNVMNHVNALSDMLNQISFETGTEGASLKTAILNRIIDPTSYSKTIEGTYHQMTLTIENSKLKGFDFDYPAKYNLPDGAAALRWAKLSEATQDYGFVSQTVTTTLDNINNIDRWCYPPELFYYVNSLIDTSNDEDFRSLYGTATTWAGDGGVLEKYENKDAFVSGNTKGVAIKKPLNYAVGRLEATLQKVTTDKLTDDAGKKISLLNSSNNPSFPLTGIIICNQHPVGFDFKPVLENGAASHANDHFIYDSQVGSSCCLSTTDDHVIPSTLVLQTYDSGEGNDGDEAEEVTIALEFRNDSGTDFRGKGGVIYPGTKFYLMGKIDPTKGTTTDENARGRVFTQDYITTITTSVNSLANAYNVLPNMLGGRLELGVELTPKWIQAETCNVILE